MYLMKSSIVCLLYVYIRIYHFNPFDNVFKDLHFFVGYLYHEAYLQRNIHMYKTIEYLSLYQGFKYNRGWVTFTHL